MIEDSDYPSSGTKPLLTSRLSVFLQQRDPQTTPTNTTFSKPATYSNCFTHSFTQGSSPNIRRTRNDDEYYGSSETTGRLPTSTISSRSSSARRSGRAPQALVGGGHPSYQADTLTSIRRSKERSQTHTDSPSR